MSGFKLNGIHSDLGKDQGAGDHFTKETFYLMIAVSQ